MNKNLVGVVLGFAAAAVILQAGCDDGSGGKDGGAGASAGSSGAAGDAGGGRGGGSGGSAGSVGTGGRGGTGAGGTGGAAGCGRDGQTYDYAVYVPATGMTVQSGCRALPPACASNPHCSCICPMDGGVTCFMSGSGMPCMCSETGGLSVLCTGV